MLRGFAGALAGFFYPPVCMGCESAVGSPSCVCGPCWSTLRLIERPYCEVLGLPFAYDHGAGFVSALAISEPPPFARARAAALHDGLAARLVSSLKYSDRTDLAIPMAGWMARAGAELLAEADAIVPVPLHAGRLFRRRFNQAGELARRLSHLSGVPYRPLVLRRVKATKSQVGLGAGARAANVRGAFQVAEARRGEIEGRRVLLVDDVYTTGSTAMSASRALRRGGAARVDILTFSRVAEEAL